MERVDETEGQSKEPSTLMIPWNSGLWASLIRYSTVQETNTNQSMNVLLQPHHIGLLNHKRSEVSTDHRTLSGIDRDEMMSRLNGTAGHLDNESNQ
ncbi:hypothetical protein FKM82_026543 [Ascaphus truei]